MTKDEAKAEAEKIIRSYRNHVAIDYQYDEEPLRGCQIECAIIDVKHTIEQIERMYPHAHYGSELKKFQSILTELNRMK